jgi:peptidyl-tRNA hydrolase
MFGGANVLSKSSKQKIVTKDSTESELVGLSDMMMPVMQCTDFLKDQGLRDIVPTIIQANMPRSP